MMQNGSVLTKRNESSPTKKIDSYSAATLEYHFCIENFEAEDDF